MKRIISVFALLFLIVMAVSFQNGAVIAKQNTQNQRLAAAKEVMKASNALKTMQAIVPMMMGQMRNLVKQGKPEAAEKLDEIFDDLDKEFTGRLGELSDLVALVYAKHFTVEELNKIITFYKTPTGKKLVGRLPLISRESFEIGRKWGQNIGVEIMKRVRQKAKEKGVDL